jgi:hypothetical protein
MQQQIVDAIFSHDDAPDEFPTECLTTLGMMFATGQIRKQPMKALACILPIAQWIVAKLQPEDQPAFGSAQSADDLTEPFQVPKRVSDCLAKLEAAA